MGYCCFNLEIQSHVKWFKAIYWDLCFCFTCSLKMSHTARLIQLRKEFAEGLMFKLIHVNLFHKLQSSCSFSYRDIIQIFICLSRERKREFKIKNQLQTSIAYVITPSTTTRKVGRSWLSLGFIYLILTKSPVYRFGHRVKN